MTESRTERVTGPELDELSARIERTSTELEEDFRGLITKPKGLLPGLLWLFRDRSIDSRVQLTISSLQLQRGIIMGAIETMRLAENVIKLVEVREKEGEQNG